jgi:threonine/homoserine/homoserine lactone efflux protein
VPTDTTLITFALVSVAIAVSPGPSNVFLLAHGVRHGRRSAMVAMVGVETAAALRVLLCSMGLSAVLASSAVVFGIVRWAGVAYLAYLGMRAVTSRDDSAGGAREPRHTVCASLRKGFLVGAGNPKMAIFFLAFFPQFVARDQGSQTTQLLVLGAVFWVIGTVWDTGFVYVTGGLGNWLRRRPRTQRLQASAEGTAYFGLAALAALGGGRGA